MMIIGSILFFSFVQSSWNYQLQLPGNPPWGTWMTPHPGIKPIVFPWDTTTVQPTTTTLKDASLINFIFPWDTITVQPTTTNPKPQLPGNPPWGTWITPKPGVKPIVFPWDTTTVQPPSTTKKDTSLIEYIMASAENVRKEMIHGNGSLGIPNMEPWTFQKSKLDME